MSIRNPKPQSNFKLWLVVLGAAVVVAALVALNAYSSRKHEPAPTAAAVTGSKSDAEQKAEGMRMGPATAKVKVVEWGDYL